MNLDRVDLTILNVLYKFAVAQEFHLAVVVDEPVSLVRERLQRLNKAKMIERYSVGWASPFLNSLKNKGLLALQNEYGSSVISNRTLSKVSSTMARHTIDELEAALYLVHVGQLESLRGFVSERDFRAKRPYTTINTASGRQMRKFIDKGIHSPDGYFVDATGEYVAIEVERTLKGRSANTQLVDNIAKNERTFSQVLWFVQKKGVREHIQKHMNVKSQIIDWNTVQVSLQQMINELPSAPSSKDESRQVHSLWRGKFAKNESIYDLTMRARNNTNSGVVMHELEGFL